MRRLAAVAVAALLAMLVAGASVVQATTPFAAADATLRTRVADDGLSGGVLLVARGDELVHRYAVGGIDARTVIPIASASKWLTSATLMTFVDEGKLAPRRSGGATPPRFRRREGRHHRPRAPVAPHRPALGGVRGRSVDARSAAACARSPAAATRSAAPGTKFHYSGVGFVVAGRLIERLERHVVRGTRSRLASPGRSG